MITLIKRLMLTGISLMLLFGTIAPDAWGSGSTTTTKKSGEPGAQCPEPPVGYVYRYTTPPYIGQIRATWDLSETVRISTIGNLDAVGSACHGAIYSRETYDISASEFYSTSPNDLRGMCVKLDYPIFNFPCLSSGFLEVVGIGGIQYDETTNSFTANVVVMPVFMEIGR